MITIKDIKAITIAEDEEFLRQVSKEVEITDVELESDIATLDKFCEEHDVLAMAAVQLGIPKRIVYLKNTDLDLVNKSNNNEITKEEKKYNEKRIFVNPVVIKSIVASVKTTSSNT